MLFRNLLLSVTLLAVMVLGVSSNGITAEEESRAAAVTSEADDGELALTGLDPVLLVAGKEVPGNPKWTLVRKDLRYQFASIASKTQFEKAPEKFEVQNDGNCAAAISSKGDPSIFTVHDGKIYVFYCTMCRESFVKEPGKYLKPRKTVAVFIFNDVELLDFAGPAEVFSAANSGLEFNVVTVAVTSKPITSLGNMKVTPNFTIDNCPKPDVLVIPGGRDFQIGQRSSRH